MNLAKMAASVLASIALLGCLPYDVTDRPRAPVDVPDRFASGGENVAARTEARTEEGVEVEPWWESFGDSTLSALEERALSQSFQVRAAWARLSQARALAEQAGAPRWPTVDVQAQGSRQRSIFGSFGAQEFSNYSLSVPVSWELDVFARIGATATAAELDARASRGDVEALAISISAQVADAYFALVEARARKALLASQLETSSTFAELIQLRFQTGSASALDVYQQRSNVIALRARVAAIDGEIASLSNQLSLLLGEPPSGVREGPTELPAPPDLTEVGVPSVVLLERPDVRAAKLRVAAADQRVGAAIADWFPKLRLSGSIGFGAQELTELFEGIVWSIVGSISQAVVDGGRRNSEIDRNRAIVQERLEQLGHTVVTALVEVDSALATERAQRANIAELEQQLEVLDAVLTEARNRYGAGLTDFLNVLTALNAKQAAEVQLLGARRQLVSARIQLMRAMGGTWTQSLAAPEPRPLEEEEAPE